MCKTFLISIIFTYLNRHNLNGLDRYINKNDPMMFSRGDNSNTADMGLRKSGINVFLKTRRVVLIYSHQHIILHFLTRTFPYTQMCSINYELKMNFRKAMHTECKLRRLGKIGSDSKQRHRQTRSQSAGY